jgi:alpha-mannosidase
MSEPTYRLHIVSHTHWDREWYHTAEQFRAHLVPLVDEVLDQGVPFLLDGQAIVLEDYLRWRPERAAEVADGLASGRLEAGPWYVLADNLIPSGEALIRNLALGAQTLGALGSVGGRGRGATLPPVLYCPDTFGHPDIGPALAAGFGLSVAVVWRGYGGRGWPDGDMARWRSRSGDEVLLYHLPPSGYETGANLPCGASEANERWQGLREELGVRSRSGELLILNGADHHALQHGIDGAVAALAQVAAPSVVRREGLAGWSGAQVRWGRRAAAPRVEGELRRSPSYVWALQGTLGTRSGQKRRNALLERLVVRDVEPWVALAAWSRGAGITPALQALWRLVLASHPHDTLCGCSIDEVAQAADDRMRRATALAATVRQDALHALTGRVAMAERPNPIGPGCVRVTNPVPRLRSGLAEVTLDIPLGAVPAGPQSAGEDPAGDAPKASVGSPAFPMQSLSAERTFVRDLWPRGYPRNRLVERRRVLLWCDELPPLGSVELPIRQRGSRVRPRHPVWVRGSTLNNGRMAVWYDGQDGLCCSNGRVQLVDVWRLVAEGERGDSYTHSAIPGTQVTAALVRQQVTMRGPLRGELTLQVELRLPERAVTTATGAQVVRRASRLAAVARVQLDAGADWFRIWIEGENTAHDLRLRAVLRTGCAAPTHLADAAFGPVRRSSLGETPHEGDVEVVPPTHPLHRWVTVSDPHRGYGVTVVSDGLTEYEVAPHGDVAITVLRAVGDLSRRHLPERPGHAGWPVATPGAQERGPFRAMCAVVPHGLEGDHTRALVERVTDDVLLPPAGETMPWSGGRERTEGLALEGETEGVRFLACLPSRDGRGLVARCANTTGAWRHLAWSLPGVQQAWLTRFDETCSGALPVADHRVRFMVPPHAVSTVILSSGA